jgi:hypothetical protein
MRGHFEELGINNIKMDLKEIGWKGGWIYLAQDSD